MNNETTKKMNAENRKKMVIAMEMLVRAMNNEGLLDSWLMCGVADGDINPYDFDTSQVEDYYIEDNNYKYLMTLFLKCMKRAQASGGLYSDGVVSD